MHIDNVYLSVMKQESLLFRNVMAEDAARSRSRSVCLSVCVSAVIIVTFANRCTDSALSKCNLLSTDRVQCALLFSLFSSLCSAISG